LGDAVHIEMDWQPELLRMSGADDLATDRELRCHEDFHLVMVVGDGQAGFFGGWIKEEPCIILGIAECFDVTEKAPKAVVMRLMEAEIPLNHAHDVNGPCCASPAMVLLVAWFCSSP